MLRRTWKLWAICAVAQLGWAKALADALPIQTTLKIGLPARSAQLSIRQAEELQLELAGSVISLPVREARSASVESVAVSQAAAVTILRASAANGEWIALLGGRSGKELLLAERVDLHGDPGERRSTIVQLTPDADSGVTALTVATQYEGLALCGSASPLLVARRALDPKTLKLVAQPDLPAARAEVTRVDGVSDSDPAPPRLRLLSATGSSQIEDLTPTVHVPHELVDGRPETIWRAPPGSVALLRYAAPLPIERFKLQLTGRTQSLTLTFYLEHETFKVLLPKPSAASDQYSFVPPSKQASACVSVALDPAATGSVQLAELQAFSALDAEGGVAQLVGNLVQDGESGSTAADLLAQLGEPGARAVSARYEELSPRGRRRALKVLASALEVPEVRARVLEAARSADEPLSEAALGVLTRGTGPGVEQALRELALEPTRAGDRAARALAVPGRSELPALFAALAAPTGADRPVLRRALIGVARRDGEAFRGASQEWLAAQPSVAARLGLVLVAVDADLKDLGTALAEQSLDASAFDERFRLSLAAAQLGASEKLDTWLVAQAQGAKEWMLRRAAYDALQRRGSPRARDLVAAIGRDPYPRVRAAAPAGLARAGQHEPLTQLALRDPWPLVRVAAVEALAQVPGSRSVLGKSLADSSRRVRAASIDALAVQKAADMWPLVATRLSASDEWPEVQAAALRFAGTLCVGAAKELLGQIARRALHPAASEDDRRLGLQAIRALHDLGGAAAEDARALATREAATPELKRAYEEFGPPHCGRLVSTLGEIGKLQP